MKIAECHCEDCGLNYIITFEKSVPPWKLSCILCKGEVKYKKIDPDENNNNVKK